MNKTFLLIDIGAVILPFLLSFHPRIRFRQHWKAFLPVNFGIALLFICGDMLFTHLHVWGFNPRYISGWHLFNLPIEELLFFVCIPYAFVFAYHCMSGLMSDRQSAELGSIINPVLIVGLTLSGILYYDRLYTCTTFLACAAVLVGLQYRKVNWTGRFYLTYLAMLPLLFLVNGLLTGAWTKEPVLWYDNNEFMEVRLLTIPFEHIFYSMLLLILNTAFYEYRLHPAKNGRIAQEPERVLEA